jgi:chitosanase
MLFSRRRFLRISSRLAVIPLLAPLFKGVASATGGASGAGQESTGPAMPSDSSLPLLDPAMATRIKAISNVFEVGSAEPDYAYVENLGDGRGYTVTQYGFCTYNGEVSWVINRHAQDVPDTPLKRFLPYLPPLASGVGTAGLAQFPQAWRAAVQASKLLAAACDEEADRLYLYPAVEAAVTAGIRSPIGLSIFYDTWLQHGASTDADSLNSILDRTISETGGRDSHSEQDFLRAFLDVRKTVLNNPANHATRFVWRQSARRVDALMNLLDNNPDLVPPVDVVNDDIHAVVL